MVGSSSVVLWNSLFVGMVASAHAVFVVIIVTPTSVERAVLSWLVLVVPLAAMSQPRCATGGLGGGGGGLGYRTVYDGGETRPAIPACGIPTGMGSVVLYCVGVCVIVSSMEYDPGSCRVQLLAVVVVADLLVVGLGHLWDNPPAVRTVVNARLFYACCVAAGNICLYWLMGAADQFPTEYRGGVAS